MSLAWFHVDPLPAAGDRLTLDADEGRHAGGARRLAAGDAVTLFDGRGGLATATLEDSDHKKRVSLRADALDQAASPSPRLCVGSSLPKGDRQSTLVSMATQLGLAEWTPLDCARSVARPGRNSAERFDRVAIAACKQSRNPWLPVLAKESAPDRFAATATREGPCFVLHPGGDALPLGRAISESDATRAGAVSLMVGPEGGFSDAEVEACEAKGAIRVSLGTTILRTETAVVAGLAVVRGVVDAR